jgi:murein DD-endopeptidase MepM/ murein hydrolase activator NlpD
VVASAFVGAGIVALGAATSMPNAEDIDPAILQSLENASLTANGIAERANDTDRASRSDGRDAAGAQLPSDADLTDAWALPLDEVVFTSAYGLRRMDAEMHTGIDLYAEEGTPYKAVHGGVVLRGNETDVHMEGHGLAVIVQHDDGTQTLYAHSSKVLVTKDQRVEAGDVLGEVGDTGHSWGAHLHIEIRLPGETNPTDPVPVLRDHGIDIKLGVETAYSDLAAS